MGQLVAVVEKRSTTPGVVRFEANRTLTGQGHERFTSSADAIGPRPAAELARRLFDTGKVDRVHVFSNIITVDLARGHDSAGLYDIVRDLYQYWKPGMEPPSFEELTAAPDGDAGGGGGGGGGGAGGGPAAAPAGDAPELSEAAKRVPAHLLERSRLARDRWKNR
jgi:hypothetical protein